MRFVKATIDKRKVIVNNVHIGGSPQRIRK